MARFFSCIIFILKNLLKYPNYKKKAVFLPTQLTLTNYKNCQEMNLRHIMCAALALSYAGSASAISPLTRNTVERQLADIQKQYDERLSLLVDAYEADSLVSEPVINPRYFRLFAQPTLYKSSVSNTLAMDWYEELYASASNDYLLLPKSSRIMHNEDVEQEIDHALIMACCHTPENFRYTEEQVMAEQVITSAEAAGQTPAFNLVPVLAPQDQQENVVKGMELKVKKPNFWKTSGETYLQFTQNYISGNWSQGGESTNTLMSGLKLNANYNDEQKINWDNTFEAKLGFTTAPSDTMHKYRTNTDMLRLSSKLGIQAFKSWYYTIEVTAKTQMTRNYRTNSNDYTSAFLSPLETTIGIGMDYKKNLKNFNVSVNIAPLSYRYLYVSDRFMVASRNGIKDGHRSLQEFGSKLTVKSSWKIAKNISWTSHLEGFTSYEKMIANWENTFDFAVSKYLSTKLFMHGRFDDGIKRKSGYNYFQFKEFLQFGLSYKW